MYTLAREVVRYGGIIPAWDMSYAILSPFAFLYGMIKLKIFSIIYIYKCTICISLWYAMDSTQTKIAHEWFIGEKKIELLKTTFKKKNKRLQWPLLLTWLNFNPRMDK